MPSARSPPPTPAYTCILGVLAGRLVLAQRALHGGAPLGQCRGKGGNQLGVGGRPGEGLGGAGAVARHRAQVARVGQG